MSANNSSSTREGTSMDLQAKFCPYDSRLALASVGTTGPHVANAALNISLSITTTLANLVVLLAMRHVTSMRLPTKLLFCSLVLTDLGTGLLVHSQMAALVFVTISGSYEPNLVRSLYMTASLLCSASLFTILGISLDRCALLYVSSYPLVITRRRVLAYLSSTWLLSIVMATSFLWNRELYHIYSMVGIFSTFAGVAVAYVVIRRSLRSHHSNQVQPTQEGAPDQQQASAAAAAANRKTSSTVLWIYMIFVICYLPFVSTSVIIALRGCTPLLHSIYEYCFTLVLVNSCINPFVYCVRLRDVRTRVKDQVLDIFFCFDDYY